MIHDVFLHVLIGVKAKGVTALLVKRLSIAGLVAFKIQEREREEICQVCIWFTFLLHSFRPSLKLSK